jgi:hypothetical protein
MKTYKNRAFVYVLEVVGLFVAQPNHANAQGTFQNLDFEQANPVVVVGSPNYPYGVTAASALPDWTVTIGGVQQTEITENDPSLGSTWVSIVTSGHGAIDGNYSVLLQNGGTASAASISQTAEIAASSESILFEAQGVGPLDLFVGTQNVLFTQVGTGPNYTLYGANISQWSGQTEQLTFSAPEAGGGGYGWHIDDISFSPSAVPEPGPVALTAIGGLLFALYRRFAPGRP